MFDNIFFWAQAIGFVAMSIRIISWQLRNSRHIIFCGMPAGALWTIHYLMLGAPLGALMNVLAVLRDGALSFIKERHVLLVIFCFCGIMWLTGLYFSRFWYDLLPLIGNSISAISFIYRSNRPLIARAAILANLPWLVYNFIVGSWIGVGSATLMIISSIIGMYRHESWEIGNCYKSFVPSVTRALLVFPNFRTYP